MRDAPIRLWWRKLKNMLKSWLSWEYALKLHHLPRSKSQLSRRYCGYQPLSSTSGEPGIGEVGRKVQVSHDLLEKMRASRSKNYRKGSTHRVGQPFGEGWLGELYQDVCALFGVLTVQSVNAPLPRHIFWHRLCSATAFGSPFSTTATLWLGTNVGFCPFSFAPKSGLLT